MEEVLDTLTVKALDDYMQVMHHWIDEQLDGKTPLHQELSALGFK